MATYPSYDANDYRAIAATEPGPLHRPGRVERLRAGVRVQDDDRDDGPRGGHGDAERPASRTSARSGSTVAETKIDNADRKGMGWMTFEDGIAYSRNVVAAKVALGLERLDGRIVRDAVRHLAEARVRRADRHRCRRRGRRARARPGRPCRGAEIDLANAAFGQGVAVTPIQLATAFATIVNGGTTVKPHVVQGVGVARRRG